MVFFVGSIFFTSAATLQWLETINADPGPALRQGTLRVLTFEPHRIDWWSSGVQLVGTVFFNFTTFHALQAGLDAGAYDRLVWRPDALGSVCFLVSGYLAYAEVCGHALWTRDRTLEWKIAAVNLVGCIAFGISAIASFWVPDSGGVLALAASNWFTALGGLCFLVGAVLLLPESAATEAVESGRSRAVRSPVMSEATVAAGPAAPEPVSKRRRVVRIVSWIVGLVLLLIVLNLLGVNVRDWLKELWDSVKAISVVYIVLGCIFQCLQTVLTALGWYGILRYAYPGGVTYMPVLAAYATGVALNNFLPANIGTFVTLLMFVAIVQGANFPGVLAGYVVQKIFYFIIGTLIYVYLFLAIAGSFDFQFGNEKDAIVNHVVLTIGIVAGAIFLIAILLRIFWTWVKKMWAKAKQGAAILGDFGSYVKLVLLPQMGGYAAKVMVIIIFLAAYSIPVTFGSVMSVLGSNQLANILSITPGGVGINQAFNAFALDSYTSSTTATAYSISQQLITTAFNVGFALVLVCVVFGWSGGSKLVKDSYVDAKVKAGEMKEQRGQMLGDDEEPETA